jgi:hypothetical protein
MFLPLVTICLLSPIDQSVDCKMFNPQEMAVTQQECRKMVGAFVKQMTPSLPAPHTIQYKCIDKSVRI